MRISAYVAPRERALSSATAPNPSNRSAGTAPSALRVTKAPGTIWIAASARAEAPQDLRKPRRLPLGAASWSPAAAYGHSPRCRAIRDPRSGMTWTLAWGSASPPAAAHRRAPSASTPPPRGGPAARPGATTAQRRDLPEPPLQLPQLAVHLPEARADRRFQCPGDDRFQRTRDIRSSSHVPPS